MYIHLGSKRSVPHKRIVGIFDLDGDVTAKINRDFLAAAQKSGIVIPAGEDIPRSFVLCEDKEGDEVILSHISSKTLAQRTEDGGEIRAPSEKETPI